MSKSSIPFEDFLMTAGVKHEAFIVNLHTFMLANNCIVSIKEAKSGYVVSYVYQPQKRTVANYVFRKNGVMLRIYADNISQYMEILEQWPASMKETIAKAGPCKRLLSPDACNPNCLKGFDFIMAHSRHQKCRNSGFMFLLDDTTKPYLDTMMKQEMKYRTEK